MRVVIQCVLEAEILKDDISVENIGKGLLLFVGFENEDRLEDIRWMVSKICNMRIFSDEKGKTNFSVQDIQGQILMMSQFTLFASTMKGNRPSFMKAGNAFFASEMYDKFFNLVKSHYDITKTKRGIFGNSYLIKLINDGPTTIFMDSKHKE